MHRAINLQSGSKQRGVVLLVVVMLVFLMTTLLVFLVEDQQLLLRRIANSSTSEQGYQLAEGASAWAMRVLHEDVNRQIDHLNEDWAVIGHVAETPSDDETSFSLTPASSEESDPLPAIDFGDIPVEFYISDLQGLYNLNNLFASDPRVRAEQKQIYVNLLQLIGIEDYETREILFASLVDWVDTNKEELPNGMESGAYGARDIPYYASDQPLSSFGELKYINGYTAQIISDLSSYATVLPSTSAQINLNATSPEVLASLSKAPVNDLNSVTAFLQVREQPEFQGFSQSDISLAGSAIINVSFGGGQPPARNMLSTSSEYFQINVKVDLGGTSFCLRNVVFRSRIKASSELSESVRLVRREFDNQCLLYQPNSKSINDRVSET